MATCRDVITRAYQLSGIIPLSDEPSAEEADLGLDALQTLFDQWVSGGMFGRLSDKLVTGAYTALEQERVVVASGSPTITIPDSYACDGEEGDDRPPYDLSLIEVVNGATRNVWLYDRTDWVDIATLALAATCPLSSRGVNGLAAALATSVIGPFATDVPASVMRASLKFLTQLSYKTGSERPARTSEYF